MGVDRVEPWPLLGCECEFPPLNTSTHTDRNRRYISQLPEMGLHGFHLDVNISACCIVFGRDRRSIRCRSLLLRTARRRPTWSLLLSVMFCARESHSMHGVARAPYGREWGSIAATFAVVVAVGRFTWNRRCPSTRWKPLIQLAVTLFFSLYSIRDSRAQTTTSGGLTGVVTDPSNALVPEAVVELRDRAKGTIQSAKTDGDGVYRFFFVAPGTYTLTVSHLGFRDESQKINVLLGPAGTRNILLKLEGSSATVKVTDDVPLLQAENGDVSTTMSRQQIAEVPNPGNDLTYIAQTAPGAIMNTDTIGVGYAGNLSILGMPGTSNLFTINGINNNNAGSNVNNSGVTGMMLGVNEVQEATIVSDSYSGQFGGAAGSSINYLTKSGSNTFHGNLLYYWNGSVLNANDWFDNAQGNPKPFDNAHQWAGSLGGPIKKDKLFFFFNAEGIRVLLPEQQLVVLPSEKFEAATMTNIDSIFGAGSADRKS